MNIACIGWGSLIWNPGALSTISTWSNDGPLLPIEFARVSSGGRVTLVLTDLPHRVQSFWCLLAADDLNEAKANLAARERIPSSNIRYSIGYWDRKTDNSHGHSKDMVKNWALPRDLDAVIWTNLKCGFRDNRGILPTIGEIIAHLQSVPESDSKEAFDYIRNAPAQIDTPYRKAISSHFKL